MVNTFLHPSLFLSLFFFTAVFIKIGFIFLLFILIDWFYGWRKSLTFKPVNPSVTDQLIDLEYSHINAVNLKTLQVP